jgi:hypothetical protein
LQLKFVELCHLPQNDKWEDNSHPAQSHKVFTLVAMQPYFIGKVLDSRGENVCALQYERNVMRFILQFKIALEEL